MFTISMLTDDVLTVMAAAIREEQKRRFMARWQEFPKLGGLGDCGTVVAIKAYRDRYKVSLHQAHLLFVRDYRN